MSISILMPALSPTMTEGNLAKWHVKAGDQILSGQVIAEIETDKAMMEVEAVEEGTIYELLMAEGTNNVAVNTPIAILLEEGESEPAPESPKTDTKIPSIPPLSPPPSDAQPTAPTAQNIPTKNSSSDGTRIFASPLAKRIAKDNKLDLSIIASQINGRGPKGRIVKADIEDFINSTKNQPNPKPSPEPTVTATPVTAPAHSNNPYEPSFKSEPLNNMRKIIAQRLTESKQNVPHFYLSMDIEIDQLLAFRKRLNEKPDADWKVSVNDLVIKSLACALRKVPAANSSFDGDRVKIYDSIDISIAVAIDGGLITPIVRAADRKGIAEIASEMKDLAARAKAGKLQPQEFQGGTISLSNLGMFGIDNFSAVINPPQAAILAIGAGVKKPVVRDDALAIATVMNATLSVDHRAIDGAVGAALLKWVKVFCEDPELMFL